MSSALEKHLFLRNCGRGVLELISHEYPHTVLSRLCISKKNKIKMSLLGKALDVKKKRKI
jgi:hypothetical protein